MWRSVRPALRATGAGRVLLVVMSAHRATTATAALTAACLSLLVTVVPAAHAAPDADSQGYVDSTARCAPPAGVVVFGLPIGWFVWRNRNEDRRRRKRRAAGVPESFAWESDAEETRAVEDRESVEVVEET